MIFKYLFFFKKNLNSFQINYMFLPNLIYYILDNISDAEINFNYLFDIN